MSLPTHILEKSGMIIYITLFVQIYHIDIAPAQYHVPSVSYGEPHWMWILFYLTFCFEGADVEVGPNIFMKTFNGFIYRPISIIKVRTEL